MICSNCEMVYEQEDYEYCANCGHQLVKRFDGKEESSPNISMKCTSCGSVLHHDDRKCPSCGAPIEQGWNNSILVPKRYHPPFCVKCGKPTNLIKEFCGYDEDVGEKKFVIHVVCPDYKMGFIFSNGHSNYNLCHYVSGWRTEFTKSQCIEEFGI